MAVWFWYILLYSFLGFLLEVAFARLTGQRKQDRKCFYLLPLCPVYGLGAAAILLLPGPVKENPPALLVCGGLAATAVEYVVGTLDRKLLGVRFWDYSALPGSLNGTVCLPFALAWGALALVLVYLVHPAVTGLAEHIPLWLTPAAAVLTAGDAAHSALLLRRTGTTDALRWYRRS